MIDYQNRRQKIYDAMAREGISLLMIEDCEGRRDPALRWLSGHPQDALLYLSVDRKSLLVPWDINMALLYGKVDMAIPYGEFERLPTAAIMGSSVKLKIPPGSKIEIPPVTPYPLFLEYVGSIGGSYDIICREGGLHREIEKLRAVKDEEEIHIYRRAADITNEIIDLLEKNVRSGKIRTESEAALFIESAARKRGCDGTGFTTLAAGPERSFGIHAFPPYTAGPFGGKGLSILDFGIKYAGYTTDVTLTFARDPNAAQEKLIVLIEKAYKLALSLVADGTGAREIARAVDVLFGKSKKLMPHGLGHGIGLEEHESPAIRSRSDNQWVLSPGMIFTLEPGLYDPIHGGCRLENDILLTGSGAEVLTTARIIRL
ncbi:MAG: Xaa-Pro peptidase family protein [Treponema sp.]|jgi:Xaa-Pro dipeptidase|nr:Xaa-Pro peptidase family protein [Treponema sp.]